jgi:hypothetical protein
MAGLLAVPSFLGKLILEKSADATLKPFEMSLKLSEQDHLAALKRTEAEYTASLKRVEEEHKTSLAFASAIDADLRTQRIPVYLKLWKMTGTLPRWPRNRELTYQDLRGLTGELRGWFFEGDGLYPSASARQAYGEVQELLTSVLEINRNGKVSDFDYDAIIAKCSALRAELTHDLLSRREAPTL